MGQVYQMKVTITIELDLSNHEGMNIPDVQSIPGSIQNLTSLFHELHIEQLEKKCNAHTVKDEVMREALIEHCKQDIAVTKQLFNNITISGTTDNGHTFVFNHQEPGYKETTIIDVSIGPNTI